MVEVEVGPIVVVDVGPSLEVVETAVLVDDLKVVEVVAGPVVVVPLKHADEVRDIQSNAHVSTTCSFRPKIFFGTIGKPNKILVPTQM